MYNHNKAQQSKNRVHISWDILYMGLDTKMSCLTHKWLEMHGCILSNVATVLEQFYTEMLQFIVNNIRKSNYTLKNKYTVS